MADVRVMTLKCPGCGAPLQVKSSVNDFACSYCGSSVQVDREGGAVSLHLLTETMVGVMRGTDRTAAELAIRRLSDELTMLGEENKALWSAQAVLKRTWSERLQRAQQKPRTRPVLVSAICISLVLAAVFHDYLGILSAALVVLYAASIWAWIVIGRGFRRFLEEEKIGQANAYDKHNATSEELQKRIQGVRARLDAQRAIVDS